jgi:PAS domain S-box-containing protein
MLFDRVLKTFRFRIFSAFLIALLPVLVLLAVTAHFFLIPSMQHSVKQELTNTTRLLTSSIRAGAAVTIRNHLKAIAEKNREIAEQHLSLVKQGVLSKEEAITRLKAIFLGQRIGSSGYIYCLDHNGTAVVHPNEKVENTDNTRFAFVLEQLKRKEGYLEYDWRNPGEKDARPKALYMVYFEALDWIISVSSYRSEFYELLNPRDFRDAVSSLQFGKSGYAYILSQEGRILVHPKLNYDTDLTKEASAADIYKPMIAQGSGNIEYTWRNPEELEKYRKIAVFERMPEYGWIIVSSAYLDEVMAPVDLTMKVIFFSTLVFCIAAGLVTFLLSGRLSRPIEAMLQQLDNNAKSGHHEPLPVYPNDETGKLAVEFNQFFKTIVAQSEQLRQERERYQSLFEASPDAIFLLHGVNIVDCNPASDLLFANDKNTLTNLSLLDLSPATQKHNENSEILAKKIIKQCEHSALQTFEWVHMASDGRLFDTEVRLKPFGTADDGEPLVVAFIRDITDEKTKQKQKAIREAHFYKAQRMEALGTLAGGIAHDFNNILSAIIGYTELTQLACRDNAKIQSYLFQLHAAGIRAKNLVQQILSFSRQSNSEKHPIDISRVINEALNMIRVSVPSTIEILQKNNSKGATVDANETQMHQIVMNLCANACHAMEKEGGLLEIDLIPVTISPRDFANYPDLSPGPYLKLAVSDTGYGISPEKMSKIFDPYFTTKTAGEGSGLGLSTVHGIVKDHGGSIKVYSELNKGSTFQIFLPLADADASLLSQTEEKLPQGTETILFVDDEKLLTEIGKEILSGLGYTVETWTNSLDAYAAFQAHPEKYDLIITDMTMPKLTGEKLAFAVQKIRRGLPVILCTGYSSSLDTARLMNTGIRKVLMKPITLAELATTVRTVLDDLNAAR